jgi:transcriptional regulator with XRE-family HTH domain
MGISQTTLSRIESDRDRQQLTENELQKFAAIFEVSANALAANILPKGRVPDTQVRLNAKQMTEVMVRLMDALHTLNQHIERMQNEYRADFELLKGENRQLRANKTKNGCKRSLKRKHKWQLSLTIIELTVQTSTVFLLPIHQKRRWRRPNAPKRSCA